jgi:hypothetical protein
VPLRPLTRVSAASAFGLEDDRKDCLRPQAARSTAQPIEAEGIGRYGVYQIGDDQARSCTTLR